MAHKLSWNTSAGLTNSTLYEGDAYDTVASHTRGAQRATPLSYSLSDTFTKKASSVSPGHHDGGISQRSLDEPEDRASRALAQHAGRMARYQQRERVCRETLASLESRIHQLEQQRWELARSYHEHQLAQKARCEADGQREAELCAAVADRTARLEQKRADLVSSLQTLDEQMKLVEDQQRWTSQTLEAQRAAVEHAEGLVRRAAEEVAHVSGEAEAATHLAASTLRHEVASLESETDARLDAMRQATAIARTDMVSAQTQLETARDELRRLRSQCEDATRAHATLTVLSEQVGAVLQTQQAELARVTARLASTRAELSAQERQLTAVVDTLTSERAQHDKALAHLQEEEARVRTAVARHAQQLTQIASCEQREAALADRENALAARQHQLETMEVTIVQKERDLCASVELLDEQARNAATLAAAAEADVLRGVATTAAVGPVPLSLSPATVALTTRVGAHFADLLDAWDLSMQRKVEAYLDASDAVRRAEAKAAMPDSAPSLLRI